MESLAVIPAAAPKRVHHKFGMSRLNYLDYCAAFENKPATDKSEEAALEGTFLHDLMDQCCKLVTAGKVATTLEALPAVLSTHFLENNEVDLLRAACKEIDKYLSRRPKIFTEIKVHTHNPDGSELNAGYFDVLLIFGGRIGILVDFKFGWLPVPPADQNLQGMGYALGCFEKFPGLDRIGVKFVQPKLNFVTEHIYERREMFSMYKRIAGVIERAKFVRELPEQSRPYLRVGPQCEWCLHASRCTALADHAGLAASKVESLPVPASFTGLDLRKPEEIALLRYWVQVLSDTWMDEVKKAAFQAAEANGGEISCTLPNGKRVVFAISERNADRVLGSAPEVAEALSEFVSPQEVLGAAKLAITTLEPIVAKSMQEVAQASGEKKLTKKAAVERMTSLLEAQGLLSRPDTKIRFLALKKEPQRQLKE